MTIKYIAIDPAIQAEAQADHLRRIREEFDTLNLRVEGEGWYACQLIDIARKFYGDCPEVLQMEKDLI